MPPPQVVQAGHVEQFSRRAVRFRGVPHDLGGGMHDAPHHLGQLPDGYIFAGADVDVTCLAVALHQKHAGVGQIVDVEELPPGRSRAPDHDFVAAFLARVVEPANHRRQDVPAVQIEVVVRPIEIGGHRRDEVAAELLAV